MPEIMKVVINRFLESEVSDERAAMLGLPEGWRYSLSSDRRLQVSLYQRLTVNPGRNLEVHGKGRDNGKPKDGCVTGRVPATRRKWWKKI